MIIAGTSIQIPIARPRGAAIIDRMLKVLELRHKGRLNRKQFLAQWSKLRMALFLCPEYQDMRTMIFKSVNDKCQKCMVRMAVHLHHNVRVAMNPRLALVPSNCETRCEKCHKAEPHT